MVGWLGRFGDFWANFWNQLTPGEATALQTAILAVGGLWALHISRARRESQTTVRLGVAVALVGAGSDRRLYVRVHIINSSARLIRKTEATLSLLSGPTRLEDGRDVYIPLEAVDPLVSVNGEIGQADAQGRVTLQYDTFPWYSAWRYHPELEPGECVESEVALPVAENAGDEWALRLILRGKQGRVPGLGKYDWGVFCLLRADLLTNKGYVAVSVHTANEE
jgi:hypothetical protein